MKGKKRLTHPCLHPPLRHAFPLFIPQRRQIQRRRSRTSPHLCCRRVELWIHPFGILYACSACFGRGLYRDISLPIVLIQSQSVCSSRPNRMVKTQRISEKRIVSGQRSIEFNSIMPRQIIKVKC